MAFAEAKNKRPMTGGTKNETPIWTLQATNRPNR